IVQEVERTAIRNLNVEHVVRKIRESIADQHEIVADQVVLIKTGAISKTSSGKIQRRATRERYLSGSLQVISKGVIQQPEASDPVAGKQAPQVVAGHPAPESRAGKSMEFSLFYFSSSDAEFTTDKYRLLLEGAKFADKHGFTAVWTPE